MTVAISLPPQSLTFPLSQAARGASLRVVSAAAGSRLELRLHELGLPKGSELRVVQRVGRHGAVVVVAHGARLAVGADIAAQIEVAPLPSP